MARRPPSLLSFLALAAMAFAGCSDGGGGGGATDDGECDLEPVLCDPEHYLANHHCIVEDVRPRVYAPDTPGPDTVAEPWVAGDFWTYRLTINGAAHDSTLVYYEDIDFANGQPQHYLVGTASPQEALDHALFSVNPMLGRIHRTLYSPHESGLHADMFNFPLCDGATWTTDFYGTTFDLRASPADLDLPGGARDAGFRIEGTSGDGSTLTHTYSPAARWFTLVDLRRADGTTVRMELLDYGGGKTGTYHFLRAQQDEAIDLSRMTNQPVILLREDGGEGPYTSIGVWIDPHRDSGAGKVEVLLKDPSGAVRACAGFPGQGVGGALRAGCVQGQLKTRDIAYAPGEWSVVVERPLLDPSAQLSGQMRVVSIYDRSGTV